MKSLKLDAGMGAGILARLATFTDLPKNGFVAGQSVASALSELYGDGKAVKYNDIDVFVPTIVLKTDNSEEGEQRTPHLKRKRVLETCAFQTTELEDDYGQINLATRKRYKVTRTSRKDMLNEVHCLFETTEAQPFLRTFDMNCVQTCIDLKTGLLHWTPEYEAFHTTRQLDIVTLHTPFQSLIRYFKKRLELEGTFGNDERIIEMLAAAQRIASMAPEGAGMTVEQRMENRGTAELAPETNWQRWRFGQGYLKKLEAVSSFILPHFELNTEMHDGYPISSLTPRFEPGADLVMGSVPRDVQSLPILSRILREKHSKGAQERLSYLGHDAGEGSLARKKLFVVGESYVQGNVTVKEIAAMDKVFSEHRVARLLHGETLGEEWANFKRVRQEVRKRGDWVYGVLENLSSSEFHGPDFSVTLDTHEKLLSETLSKAALPEMQLKGYALKELTTGMEMWSEGNEQHHCVGGYAQEVKSGRTRIISMQAASVEERLPATRITFQLGHFGKTWRVSQVRGLQNRPPTKEESAVAETYCSYSNLAYILGSRATLGLIAAAPGVAEKMGNLSVQLLSWTTSTPQPLRNLHMKAIRHWDLPTSFRGTNGQQVYAGLSVFKYWAALAKHKISPVKQGSYLKPAWARAGEVDEELPF